MKPRFLLDENMSPDFRKALIRRLPYIDVLLVGDHGAPPRKTPDEEILRYLDDAGRILVTKNRASMPEHLRAHFDRGGKHWGILTLDAKVNFEAIVESLALIEGASEAEEWINKMMWIPF